ncbi:MAG: class I SAM-dependent methyltransferase, partial [Pygmaiobacter sp.]
RCPRVIATDLRVEPLTVARETILRAGQTDKVDCRLGDGLSVVQPNEVRDIIIAGMSGESICSILEAAPWTRSDAYNFILVPTTKHGVLRRWLYQNGYELRGEVPVQQRRYCYTVMQAAYTARTAEPDALFCALGLYLGQKGNGTLCYLKKIQMRAEKELRGKRAGTRYPDLAAEEALCQQIAEEVKRCQE